MADILGAVFRRFASVSSHLTFPLDFEGNTLVLGDRNCSRSVLFLAAVTAATDLGLKVLFFTQTPFESLHVSLRGSVPGLKLEALKNVKFVYAKTLEEFLEDVASLHELGSPPSLIIVDDLERYLHRPRSGPLQDDLSPVAHVAALLHDTAAFLTQILHNRGENQGPCRVMVSFQSECDGRCDSEAQAADLLPAVLERYLQVRCILEEVTGDGEAGKKEWQVYLSVTRPPPDRQGQQWHLVVKSNGAVEFRPVTDGERQISDIKEQEAKDEETENKYVN